jgi:hypothetical protein
VGVRGELPRATTKRGNLNAQATPLHPPRPMMAVGGKPDETSAQNTGHRTQDTHRLIESQSATQPQSTTTNDSVSSRQRNDLEERLSFATRNSLQSRKMASVCPSQQRSLFGTQSHELRALLGRLRDEKFSKIQAPQQKSFGRQPSLNVTGQPGA